MCTPCTPHCSGFSFVAQLGQMGRLGQHRQASQHRQAALQATLEQRRAVAPRNTGLALALRRGPTRSVESCPGCGGSGGGRDNISSCAYCGRDK